MRFSTRFQKCVISLASQCALLASRKASYASRFAPSPCDLNTSMAMPSSLMRRCRMASSSSRAACSGQNDAPCPTMPSMSAGGGVVGHDNVVGGERQLVPAAGRGTVDDADELLAGIFAGILKAVAGLVGELAEIDLVRMGRARQHADIGAGAEHAVFSGTQHD